MLQERFRVGVGQVIAGVLDKRWRSGAGEVLDSEHVLAKRFW